MEVYYNLLNYGYRLRDAFTGKRSLKITPNQSAYISSSLENVWNVLGKQDKKICKKNIIAVIRNRL